MRVLYNSYTFFDALYKEIMLLFVGYLGTWLVEVDCPLSELADQFPDEECTGSSLSHFLLANPTFPLSLNLTDTDDDESMLLSCFNLILPQSFSKSRLDFFSFATTVVLLETTSSESLLLSDKELKKNETFYLDIRKFIWYISRWIRYPITASNSFWSVPAIVFLLLPLGLLLFRRLTDVSNSTFCRDRLSALIRLKLLPDTSTSTICGGNLNKIVYIIIYLKNQLIGTKNNKYYKNV